MIDFTEADLRRFAPKMADFYRKALLEGKAHLEAAGILENGKRFSHFMAQVGAETGGGTILRESLTYTRVARIREVWPARSRGKSDAELKPLLRNPVGLGDWAYGGRMGNAKGTSDGYDYRGGGFIQTTGKAAVQEYCDRCKIEIRPDILDDADATLKFACTEWADTKCNALADKNDLLRISKAINTGSAESGVMPNGMTDREAWFKRAQAIWWDAEDISAKAPEPPPIQAPITRAATGRTTRGLLITVLGGVAYIFRETVEVFTAAAAQFEALAPVAKVLAGLGLSVAAIALVTALAGIGLSAFARFDDARKGVILK